MQADSSALPQNDDIRLNTESLKFLKIKMTQILDCHIKSDNDTLLQEQFLRQVQDKNISVNQNEFGLLNDFFKRSLIFFSFSSEFMPNIFKTKGSIWSKTIFPSAKYVKESAR